MVEACDQLSATSMKWHWAFGWIGLLLLGGCSAEPPATAEPQPDWPEEVSGQTSFTQVAVDHTVYVGTIFRFLDSLSVAHQPQVDYPLNDHLWLQANPWLIERMAGTDYYLMMAADSFVYDQRQLVLLRANDSLWLPGQAWGEELWRRSANTWIDINIPEYTLRIYRNGQELLRAIVRVGRHGKGYFADTGREEDLRTRTGEGSIADINYDPIFANPRTGKRYETTGRDDGRRTLLPRIPSLEPEINGRCTGQLIHCTTNPETLGRAYSHGCIGIGEADMWRIYAYSPVGTRIRIRYDLIGQREDGSLYKLTDIYRLYPEN